MKRDDLPRFADLRNGGNLPRYPEGGWMPVAVIVVALIWTAVAAWVLL
jgi:hypothetical protein